MAKSQYYPRLSSYHIIGKKCVTIIFSLKILKELKIVFCQHYYSNTKRDIDFQSPASKSQAHFIKKLLTFKVWQTIMPSPDKFTLRRVAIMKARNVPIPSTPLQVLISTFATPSPYDLGGCLLWQTFFFFLICIYLFIFISM